MNAQNRRNSRGAVRRVRAPIRWAWIVALIIAALAGLVGHGEPDPVNAEPAASIEAELPDPHATQLQRDQRAMRS